ncbi:MAG TPA: TetR/AcrR family transcriptional regulator C-terminal ligand-binding domain-containing protein [Candidatus Limnocylindrales bacterium]|nr:TetR/AcrR family transcriptional regulator C-terminal ligand-binding domain-containing protein [Candidatus Limnocylindrales bacterium]
MPATGPSRRKRTTAPASGPSSGDSSPPRGRPRDPSADEAILEATFRHLIDVGYGGLSIEAVAAAAGVAKTTIYRRWPTKRDLVVAALETETPFEPPRIDVDSRTALGMFVRTAIAMLIESGAIRILGSLLVEEQREPGLLGAFRRRILEPRRGMVEAMLRAGIARGEIRADIDPLVVTEMIAGAVFGHHAILGLTATEPWIDALVDHVWEAIRVR